MDFLTTQRARQSRSKTREPPKVELRLLVDMHAVQCADDLLLMLAHPFAAFGRSLDVTVAGRINASVNGKPARPEIAVARRSIKISDRTNARILPPLD